MSINLALGILESYKIVVNFSPSANLYRIGTRTYTEIEIVNYAKSLVASKKRGN